MKQWFELTQDQQEAVTAALAYPFPPDEIEWLALATYEKDGQHFAKGGAYADLRAYQYRLDTVCGQNWTVRYRPLPAPPKGNVGLICSLTIFGRTMEDVGEAAADDPNAWTSAMAQAFKRTASALQCYGPLPLRPGCAVGALRQGQEALYQRRRRHPQQALLRVVCAGHRPEDRPRAPGAAAANFQRAAANFHGPERPGSPGAAAATAGAAAATDWPQQQQTVPQQQQQRTANPTGPITDDTKRQIYATAQAIFGEADWIDALAWYTAAFAKTPLAVTKTLSPDQFQEGEAQTFLAAMVKNAPVLPEFWLSAKTTIIAARAGQAQPLPAQQHQTAMRPN